MSSKRQKYKDKVNNNIKDELYLIIFKIIPKLPLWVSLCYCVNKLSGKTTKIDSNFMPELIKLFIEAQDLIPTISKVIGISLCVIIIILLFYIKIIKINYKRQIKELKGGKND